MNNSHTDERLAILLEQVTQQQKQGFSVDWKKIDQENPELVGELRQLLAVGQLMQGLAHSSESTVGFKTKNNTPPTPPPRSIGPMICEKNWDAEAWGLFIKPGTAN